jgi:hypothetical protein
MLKDVAMIHEGTLATRPAIERHEELSLIFDEQHVFPAGEMRRQPFIDGRAGG